MFLSSYFGVAQHQLATYTAHESVVEAIRIQTDVIEGEELLFLKSRQIANL